MKIFGSLKTAPGKLGQALLFNTSSNASSILDTNQTNNVSMAVWIYWTGASATAAVPFYNGNSGADGYGFIIANNACATGNILNILAGGKNCNGAGSTYIMPANNWVHAVLVRRDTNVIYLYVNGVLVSSQSQAINTPSLSTFFGANSGGTTGFQGSIDDARIYNRALSAAEIQQLYKLGGGKINKSDTTRPSLLSGLVGWWTMDGKDVTVTTATDKSGFGANATRQNSTKLTQGKIGQAMSFSSSTNDYLLYTASQNITSTMSISIWYKTNTKTLPASHRMMYGLTGATYFSLVSSLTASPFFSLITGATQKTVNSSIPSTIGRWTHTAATYDGSYIKIYVDGVYQNQSVATGTIGGFTNVSNKYIGRWALDGYNFDGSLDDVRIYNRALSDQEVQQLYKLGGGKINKSDATRPSLLSGLVGWWTMDGKDVTSTAVIDKSGNGNNGTRTAAGTSVITGKIGQAMKFDGASGKITLPSFTTGPTLTMSCWFKTTYTSQQPCINNYNNTLGVYFGMGGTGHGMFSYSSNNTPASLEDLTPANNGKWHYGAYTIDGIKGRLYLDGVMKKETNQTRTGFSGTGNIGFGGAVNDYWHGSIDDVRIYNRALSPQEVMMSYRMGK